MSRDKQVRQLAAEIGHRWQPERIILFGSHARGTARSNSDVDLLIITHYSGSSIDQSLKILHSLEHRLPVDLVVRSPEEIERRVRLGDFFLRDILREGKVVYERPD